MRGRRNERDSAYALATTQQAGTTDTGCDVHLSGLEGLAPAAELLVLAIGPARAIMDDMDITRGLREGWRQEVMVEHQAEQYDQQKALHWHWHEHRAVSNE